MTLAAVTGINSLTDAVDLAKNNLADMIETTIAAFEEYSKKQEEVYQTAGTSLVEAQEYFETEAEIISEESLARVERTTELADRIGTAFEETASKVRDFNKDIYDLTLEYEKLNEVMIRFLEISGEYIPGEKLDFTSKIDSWVEFD